MKTRLLYTEGTGDFKETNYEVNNITPNEIRVRAVMTGVCRSDIDMMTGDFGILPLGMQGHEGLGQVVEVGSDITNVKIGDYVATRGEPAYADFYNVKEREFVKVPAAEPKYILEPVACGINVVTQPLREIAERSGAGKRLLILGSGFLAWVAYNTVLLNHLAFDITVVGSSNKDLWGDLLARDHFGTYDVIIDLSSRDDVFQMPIVNNQALIVFGAQKQVTTDFGNLLWKACTIIFPSPRTDNFYSAMQDAARWIESGDIVIDKFWTKAYNRNTEWKDAFEDSVSRKANFGRAYIYWDDHVRYE